MIAVVVAILGIMVIGVPVALAIDRDLRGGAVVGLGFLYGTGVVYVVMALLPWKLPVVVGAMLAVAIVAYVIASRHPDPSPSSRLGMTERGRLGMTVVSIVADLTTAITLIGYTLYATMTSPWEWDFNAVWGLKARTFFEQGGIDWRFIQSPWNDFAHPDYPLLVPMNFDFLALVSGGWSDRWLGFLFAAYAIALLLIVREVMRSDFAAPFPALITLAIASLACTRDIGMAEGALVAFATAAMLMTRAGRFLSAGIILGLAASAKNEGALFIVAVVLALVIARRWRDAVKLWPAVVIIAPWKIIAALRHLKGVFEGPPLTQRVPAHLAHWWDFVRALVTSTPDVALWILILVSILIARSAARRQEGPYLLMIFLQIGGFLAAYLATPFDMQWHIATSWPRLARQVVPAAAILALVLLAKTFLQEKNLAHAEAGSEL